MIIEVNADAPLRDHRQLAERNVDRDQQASRYVPVAVSIGCKDRKQALRLKNKVIDKSHRARKTGAIVPATADVAPAPSAPRIIKSRRYPIKPMAEDEAQRCFC